MSFANLIASLKEHKEGVVGPLIDSWLLERNGISKEVEQWVHPSSLPEIEKLCSREIFFNLYTPLEIYPVELLTQNHKPRIHRIFDNGTSFHRRWQAYLIELGIMDPRVRFGWEIGLRDESLRMTGHADGIVYPDAYGKNIVRLKRGGLANGEIPITLSDGGYDYEVWDEKAKKWIAREADLAAKERAWKPYGKPVMIELKSINDRGFQMLNGPLPKHITQATAYMGWLRESAHPSLDLTIFLYEGKNDQEFKEFHLPFNPELFQKIKGPLEQVRDAKAKGQLPKGVCRSGLDPRADECPHANICFTVKNYKELINKGKSLAPKKGRK